jgi:hypothetical protein
MDAAAAAVYALGAAGEWELVLDALCGGGAFGRACARYAHPGTGRFLLHAAVSAGHEGAQARLLALMAPPPPDDGGDGAAGTPPPPPPAVLTLAALLRGGGVSAAGGKPRALIPCSHEYPAAPMATAAAGPLAIDYAGGVVKIPAGGRYFADGIGLPFIGEG